MKYIPSVFGIIVIFGLVSFPVRAASLPSVLVTWKAGGYAPGTFSGKKLPSVGTPVSASVQVADNGTIADLSDRNIFWYVNDDLIGSGTGLTRVHFRTPRDGSRTVSLRVQLPDYKGDLLLKTVDIPVVNPFLVIEAPYPGNVFVTVPATVTAIPYFFNTITSSADLLFSWSVNGVLQGVTSPTLSFDVNRDARIGSRISIEARTQNDSGTERGYGSAALTFGR